MKQVIGINEEELRENIKRIKTGEDFTVPLRLLRFSKEFRDTIREEMLEAYNKDPFNIARHKEYAKVYSQKPGVKEKQRVASKKYHAKLIKKPGMRKLLNEKSCKWRRENLLKAREIARRSFKRAYQRDRDKHLIRSKTRYFFPITSSQKCEVCKSHKAKERHHNTTPIVFDKFLFLCKPCHLNSHNTYKFY